MRNLGFVGRTVGLAVLGTGLGIAGRAIWRARRATSVRDGLAASSPQRSFHPSMVDGLPEPARRYLLHAIAEGTPLSLYVDLELAGSVVPRPGGRRLELRCEERLAPGVGFLWRARGTAWPVPVRIEDHYHLDAGEVTITAAGLVPVGGERGPDVVRSSRGRLALEAIWCPTALVAPDQGTSWQAVDDERVRLVQTIDREAEAVLLRVDPDGRILEATMERWGNVGLTAHEALPYGFAVERERAFAGVTLPSELRGGWWYGTERFDPALESRFRLLGATFG